MCNWQSWIWPGIAAIGMLTALAFWFHIAADNRPQSNAQLQTAPAALQQLHVARQITEAD